jgi:hypothetical protein
MNYLQQSCVEYLLENDNKIDGRFSLPGVLDFASIPATFDKTSKTYIAMWVTFLNCMKERLPDSALKYPGQEEFLSVYGDDFAAMPQSDIDTFRATANWYSTLFSFMPAYGNKAFSTSVIGRLVEGWNARYTSDEAKAYGVRIRSIIYEQEGCVLPRGSKSATKNQSVVPVSVILFGPFADGMTTRKKRKYTRSFNKAAKVHRTDVEEEEERQVAYAHPINVDKFRSHTIAAAMNQSDSEDETHQHRGTTDDEDNDDDTSDDELTRFGAKTTHDGSVQPEVGPIWDQVVRFQLEQLGDIDGFEDSDHEWFVQTFAGFDSFTPDSSQMNLVS